MVFGAAEGVFAGPGDMGAGIAGQSAGLLLPSTAGTEPDVRRFSQFNRSEPVLESVPSQSCLSGDESDQAPSVAKPPHPGLLRHR
jgi:hypothetical protein